MKKYRVLFNACIGDVEASPYISKEYESYIEANSVLEEIALYTLYLHDCSFMEDHSNYGVVQQFIEKEWEDMN